MQQKKNDSSKKPLDEKGLPCCDEDGSIFGSDENTLQKINPK